MEKRREKLVINANMPPGCIDFYSFIFSNFFLKYLGEMNIK